MKNIKMPCFVTFIMFIIIMTSCNTFSKTKRYEGKNEVCPLNTSFPVSGTTELFLRQFCDIDTNIPEDSLQDLMNEFARMYNLRKIGDSCYYLCGFIKFDTLFKADEMKRKGVLINTTIKDMRSICIPMKYIKEFFLQPGVKYFEADLPVYPLNTR